MPSKRPRATEKEEEPAEAPPAPKSATPPRLGDIPGVIALPLPGKEASPEREEAEEEGAGSDAESDFWKEVMEEERRYTQEEAPRRAAFEEKRKREQSEVPTSILDNLARKRGPATPHKAISSGVPLSPPPLPQKKASVGRQRRASANDAPMDNGGEHGGRPP